MLLIGNSPTHFYFIENLGGWWNLCPEIKISGKFGVFSLVVFQNLGLFYVYFST